MKRSKIAAYFLVLTVLATVLLPTGAVHAKIIGSGTALSSVNGVFDAEAEDLPFDDDYLGLSTNDSFSDGMGLYVLKEDKTQPAVSDPAHLDASFIADKAGTYTIWVRGTASAANSAGRSVYVSINQGEYKDTNLNNNAGDPPKWMKLTTATASAPGQTVSIRIRRRQNYNIVLDRIYCTTDASFTPNDTNVALSPPISYDLTPTKLTTLRDSLNAWHGMTAGEVLADVSVADGFGLTKQIYAADGSIVSPDTPASEGMYIRVSKSAVKYADHPLVYSDHRVGPVSYSVAGINGASCWDENGYKGAKLNASVTIDSFVNDVSKDYTLVITQKKDGRLTDIASKSITVGAKGSSTITLDYDIEDGSDAIYQIYLWDNFASITPLSKSYILSPKLRGKKMAVFGDSITNGFITYPSDIGLINGMTYSDNSSKTDIFNVAVGGARMSSHNDPVGVCSMVSLVDTLTDPAKDFSAQQQYLGGLGGWTNGTFIYNNMVALKEQIQTIDYATVFYGTNDFTASVKLDNESNIYDTTTFGGATRYSIEKLIAANPDIQILLVAPMYRDRQLKNTDTDTDLKNSDEYPNGNKDYLQDFGAKLKEIAQNYDNVYFYDMYTESGINKYNQADYFYDGLHPIGPTHSGTLYPNSSPGHRLLAARFSHAMQMYFK